MSACLQEYYTKQEEFLRENNATDGSLLVTFPQMYIYGEPVFIGNYLFDIDLVDHFDEHTMATNLASFQYILLFPQFASVEFENYRVCSAHIILLTFIHATHNFVAAIRDANHIET